MTLTLASDVRGLGVEMIREVKDLFTPHMPMQAAQAMRRDRRRAVQGLVPDLAARGFPVGSPLEGVDWLIQDISARIFMGFVCCFLTALLRRPTLTSVPE